MPFAAGLRESLQLRQNQVPAELTKGEPLEQVLAKHLRTVEAMAEGELIPSILLLSSDGKRLSHGAAPGLPESYCDAIDGSEIGPHAGSCGTAAYLGRPVYVSDIATDPLWADYRHLALPHGLRSCWSTPIYAPDRALVGTFAIYRRTVGNPSRDEIEAIDMIAEHVAHAIILARDIQDLQPRPRYKPRLTLIGGDPCQSELPPDRDVQLLGLVTRLQSKADELDRMSHRAKSRETMEAMKTAVQLSRKLIAVLRREIDEIHTTPSA
jgi:GAF domain-containing protein